MAKPRAQTVKVTWAQAVRDTSIAAMNRGQLPFYCLFIFAALVIVKMPGEDVSKLASDIVNKLAKGELWSYGLLFASLTGWYVHSRRMRTLYSGEFRRVGREKSDLQKKASKVSLKSSEG